MNTNFTTNVNDVSDPSDMNLSDILMHPKIYSYEGNWAFCRFDHPDLLGARLGFGIGEDFSEDRGWNVPAMKEIESHYRIEILTRRGAYLYIHTGNENELILDRNHFSHIIHGDDRELLRVEQFPIMRWKMESTDGSLKVDVIMEPLVTVTLPNNIQKNTTFSMWLAPCKLSGIVTIDGKTEEIKGTAFLDHPRLKKENNNPKEFGSYLYTPVILDDSTHFFSYYTDFVDSERNDDYSFGYHIDKDLNVIKYRCVSITNLYFTSENQVECADLVFVNENSEIHLSIREEYLPIHRSWGAGNPSSDKMNYFIYPQIFKAEYLFKDATNEIRQSGKGLLEYVQNDKRTYNKRLETK